MGVCINFFGVPVIGDKECADAYRNDRNERIETRKDASVEKTKVRQEERSKRTGFRCEDGSCGVSGAIDSVGGALGGILGGATSGLLGPLPLILGGVAVVGLGVYAYKSAR